MIQTIAKLDGDGIIHKSFPDPSDFVLPGVRWGRCEELLTPAYWATQAWLSENKEFYRNFRIGASLKEEITACVLGGYGIPAEIGLAAFERIRTLGYLSGLPPSRKDLFRVLKQPFKVGNRDIHYRFAKQKSKYLSKILQALSSEFPPNSCSKEFREWLLRFGGIGPKTASWITRNWLSSDDVAIIDVHIRRAGLHIGLFNNSEQVENNYFSMEFKFLRFAGAIGVRPSILDALMWSQMRKIRRMLFGAPLRLTLTIRSPRISRGI